MTHMNTYQPPCRECGGSCCRYVAIEIDAPKSKRAVDDMRWYLLHRDVNIFQEDSKKWYVEFRTPCERQTEDGLCGYYDDRPRICRHHGEAEESCEFFAPPYIRYFTKVEDFEAYLDRIGFDWRYKRL